MTQFPDPFAAVKRDQPAVILKAGRQLLQQSWHNWLLMLFTLLMTTVGLGAAVGILMSGRERSPWAWSGSEWVLLAGLSILVGLFGSYLTVQRRRLFRLASELNEARETAMAAASRHHARLMALSRVSQTMANESDIESVFAGMTQHCFTFFECDRVSVMLVDRQTGELVVRAAMGFQGAADMIGSRQQPGQGIAGWVARHREPVILGEVVEPGRFEGFEPSKGGLTAALVVPIVVRDELVGVMSLSSRKPGIEYCQEDLKALEIFAGNAGISLRHTER
ncbi:MAG: GAF sensor-containing adenylate/guanylate cyclase, partial [bacterium]